ncbi:helix-turn-helix transcriptional regulator [Catellatospora citrea]|uniref:helix-turn-helix transcriptional regulator n=1 Tax=Catellatospora citrea TaxID=53366 RepID=UPI00340CACA3
MAGRSELGEFLRTCRARVSPETIGLLDQSGSVGGRRVPGLRREEVARLAGVSIDYYTRLEQGRHASPSEAVVEALSRVFSLDRAARAHLFDLARPARREPAHDHAQQRVRPAVHQMIASMAGNPAFLLGCRTDVLAANALARALLVDWRQLPVRERNYTRWMLLAPEARAVHDDWPSVAADAVGNLRLYAGRHPEDTRLAELVDELTAASPEFRTWWNGHRVQDRTYGTKQLTHPLAGPMTIHYEALVLPGDPDQTLFIYSTDPGSRSTANMRLLAMYAGQEGNGPEAADAPQHQKATT